jgi:hypothetical protein
MIALTHLRVWLPLTLAAASRRTGDLAPHLPATAARAAELAGCACAAVFLHQVWAPLVWAAAAVVLILAGQRR